MVIGLVVITLAMIVNLTTESNFRHFINKENPKLNKELVERLEVYYAQNDSWEGAEYLLPDYGSPNRGKKLMVTDLNWQIVLSAQDEFIGNYLEETISARARPLMVNGTQIGWAGYSLPSDRTLTEAETQFLLDTSRGLALAALIAGLISVVVSIILARQMARPLSVITEAAHNLAAGALGQQVRVEGAAAEVLELADAFNRMSHDLAEGEALRRRMSADIAHELRTPVSILRGHIEAMLDGVFPLNQEHLAIAHDQTLHLTRLVEDLRLLTLAEAGRLELKFVPAAPADLINQIIEHFEPLALDANIRLTQQVAPGLPEVWVDTDRIQQVLGNLLSNAIRHTPADGQVSLHADVYPKAVHFVVSNTGNGLTPDQAKHVFERFWRAEEARTRDSGGSGLGLAITQQLIILHGGEIWAEAKPDRTTFIFTLPTAGSV